MRAYQPVWSRVIRQLVMGSDSTREVIESTSSTDMFSWSCTNFCFISWHNSSLWDLNIAPVSYLFKSILKVAPSSFWFYSVKGLHNSIEDCRSLRDFSDSWVSSLIPTVTSLNTASYVACRGSWRIFSSVKMSLHCRFTIIWIPLSIALRARPLSSFAYNIIARQVYRELIGLLQRLSWFKAFFKFWWRSFCSTYLWSSVWIWHSDSSCLSKVWIKAKV